MNSTGGLNIFEKNMQLLRVHFPSLWSKIQDMESSLERKLIKVDTSGEQVNLLLRRNKQKIYLHDRDNPVAEAEDLIREQLDIETQSDVLFYGIGLAYHIQAFQRQYPGAMFSIYEPVPEIFFRFLEQADLSSLNLSSIKYLFLEDSPAYAENVVREFVGQMRDSVCVIDLPAYKDAFAKQYRNFFNSFELAINERRSLINTTSAFEKIWTVNSMLNLGQVLSTPNLLLAKGNAFRGLPAILIGAGPSLDEEIENLRVIKDNGLAYIFSAGAAINTLVDCQVLPHAACTYDPTEKNQLVFKKLIDKGLAHIPLIFGSSVGYTTLAQYPGPKYHMLTTPDKIGPFYLKSGLEEKLPTVSDAPSIAAVTLQMLIQLGFNPIILVGINLAYKDNKQHAAGLDYSQATVNSRQLDLALRVEDVHGDITLTNPTYNRMRAQMELYTSIYRDTAIINATRGGARIKGTTYQALDELIGSRLKEPVYQEDWLSIAGFEYDLKHLVNRYLKMKKSREELDSLLGSLHTFLYKIKQQAEEEKFRNMEYMYAAMDNVFNQLQANHFFKNVVMPMNQLALEVLQRAEINIHRENNNYKQAMMTVSEYREYIYSCENDIQMINPAYQLMNTAMESFIKQQIKNRASKIKILITDSEGILTDGTWLCSRRGIERVKLNLRDHTAVKKLEQKGIKTVILTRFPRQRTETIGKLLNIKDLYTVAESKFQQIENICMEMELGLEQAACVLEDQRDVELAGKLGLTFGVNDASQSVTAAVDYVCTLKGGQGVLQEVAGVLLGEDFNLPGTVIRP